MGIFSSKDDKRNQLMDKLELSALSEKDYNMVKLATGYQSLAEMNYAIAISAKSEEQVKINYLATIANQNWLIIKQLDRLNKSLENIKID